MQTRPTEKAPKTIRSWRWRHSWAAGCAAVLLGSACASTTARGVETRMAEILVSDDQENQIGLQLKTELETKEGIVYLQDPEAVEYVRRIAENVTRIGRRDRPEVNWSVFVIDDRTTVNAFASPGGYLYIYRGLLEAADDEAQLIGVLAHETGHVVARHAARSLVAQYGLEAVIAMALGKEPNLIAELGSVVAAKGVLLAHSRADETEADEYGVRYTAGAGYDPRALVAFFGVLQKQEGKTPASLVYLSDHPATEDRITHLNEYIAANQLSGVDTGRDNYLRFKQRLVTLPAAAAPHPAQ